MPFLPRLHALDRKVLRDLWHLRGPMIAIAVVVLCGVASFVAMRSMVPHLAQAQAAYYRTAHFAHVWTRVTRAPNAVLRDLAAIPGVTTVEARVSGDVVVDVPGLREPATGRVMGIPTSRVPTLNRLAIQRGRTVAPGRDDEVVVSEGFATANGLAPGDSLGVVMHGRWRQLRIVGVGLSPEFVLELRPADLFPDNRRFGILWVDETLAAAAFGVQGAWNDAVFGLAAHADERAVIAQLDAQLTRYGSFGAYGRNVQVSHRYLSDEIEQARAFATAAPLILLGVAAFLVNIVLSRLVTSQREQVGMLKAFGLTAWELSRHYMLLALGPVLAGAVAGTLLGVWLAGRLATVYAQSYRIPDAPFEVSPGVIIVAVAISVAAALLGAVHAVRRVQRLPAAEAMRAESPPRYRAGIAERIGLTRRLPPVARMTWRSIARRPWRAALSVVGMAMGVGVMMVGLFMFDAIDALRDVQFEAAQREDLAVTFTGPRGDAALRELAHLPGVTRVEPVRAIPVQLQHGPHVRQVAIVAVHDGARLRRVVDRKGKAVAMPGQGLLLSRALSTLLDVGVGDMLHVQVLDGWRHAQSMPVGALLDDLVGTNVYLPASTLRTLAAASGISPDVSDGAVLTVEPHWRDAVYTRLKHSPGVAGISARASLLANFDRLMETSFNVTLVTLLAFASAISVGVVYNTARIALSERGRELASLRVLGFARSEVARMLFGEQFVLGVVAIPLGCAIGAAFAALIVAGLSSELFRLPFSLRGRTFGYAALLLAVSGVLSSVLVRRTLDRLDLVSVLKTRE